MTLDTLDTLDYYVKGSWLHDIYRFSDTYFVGIEKYLDTEYPSTFTRRVFSTIALRNPMRFENSSLSFLYPFEQLTFILTK